LSDPFGQKESTANAAFAGIVIGRSNLPLAHEGDALYHVAAFEKLSDAESIVDEFQAQNERVPDAGPPPPEYGRTA